MPYRLLNTMDNPIRNTELGLHLTRFNHRLRLRDGWLLAQRTLWLAALIALLIQLIGRLWPIEYLWIWTITPVLIWLLGGAGFILLRPLSPMRTARRVDAELGLRERLSTALALGEQQSAFPATLVYAQRQDALIAARAIDPGKAFPFGFLRRPLLAAAIFVVAVIASAILTNPMDVILAQRAEVTQEAARQAEKIDELRQQIESAEELSPEAREELLRQLAELGEQLRTNTGDLEQALADLSRVDEEFRQKMDPKASARQANLTALATQLQALTGQEADSGEDLEQAVGALQELVDQMSDMDDAQLQAVAESLAQMAAQAAQSGNVELGQAISALAQAIGSGDQAAASQAAQLTTEAVASVQQDLAAQDALQQALTQLDSSRQALAQAGRSTTQAQGVGQNQTSGQSPGQGQNQGQNQGQGPGQSQGQPGGGGGTNANTLPPATSQGSANRPQGPGQSVPEGDLGSQVFVPWERRPEGGEQLYIPGQDTGQGDIQVSEGQDPLPGASSPALVPYHEVYYSYLNAANQAMEGSYIPSALKDYVREYFSRLEP